MKNMIELMRPKHYIKNFLIFLALGSSGQIFDQQKFIRCLIGFISFCLLTSVVYIINDIFDINKDKLHNTKCNRPLPSGRVSVKSAWILDVSIFIVAVLCSFLIFDIDAFLLILLYFGLNIMYSFGLKNIPLLDVIILVAGFVIRVLYGAILSYTPVSSWLYLCVFSFAFFLAFGKRRNEIKKNNGNNTRNVLKKYSIEFLDKSLYLCLGLTNVFYSLWSVALDTSERYGGSRIEYTVPFVLIITLRYSMIIEGDDEGDPVDVLLRDNVLMTLCAIYILLMFGLLYFPKI